MKTTRMTLDLPEAAYQRLNRLVTTTGAPSKAKAAVLRKAIDLYDILSKNAAAGGQVIMHKPGQPDQKMLLVIL